MKYLLLISLLYFIPLTLETFIKVPLSASIQAEEAKSKKKQRRKVPSIKERTYKILSEAQALIDPDSMIYEDESKKPDIQANPQQAIEMLKKALGKRGLNNYEIAQFWNTLAFAYYTLEDYPNTKRAYEKVIKQAEISLALEKGATRALFQLTYADEEYLKTISYIDKWHKLNETLDPNILFIKTLAYYQLEDYSKALNTALQVEQVAITQDKVVKESWLNIQVVLYNQLKDDDNAIRILERLVVEYSKKQYWMVLAGMYGEKNWEDKSLSAFYAAYIQGFFAREAEIVMLSQRLLNAEVPFEAAIVLEDGFKNKLVSKNEKNIRLLATAYSVSKNYDKAINAWQEATQFAEDGEIFYQLAQALSYEDRHEEAIKAYHQALDKKGIKDEKEVQFRLGISLVQLEEWNAATKVFRIVAKDKRRRKTANKYIRYIANEKKRAALNELYSST